MTDEQINVAIAEACGWTDIHDDPMLGWLGNPPDLQGSKWPILRYTECLNAMHEAEELLIKNHNFWTNYYYCIGATIVLHATARQRARAFVKTIGRWEE